MSKLNELLAELCPDGVKNKKIKDVYKRLKGTPITAAKMREIENSNGEIRIFAGGKTVIDAAEVDIPDANITRVPAVLVQSRGVIDAIYYDKPFTFKNEMWAYTADEKVSVKFLYYVLKNNIEYFRTAASEMGSMPQISLSVTEEFIIPVPPLPVQREIVRILDNFTELTAELTARRKQYEHYRTIILSSAHQSEAKKLGDICDFVRGPFGGSLKKDNFTTSGYAVYEQQHAIYADFKFRYFIDAQKYNSMKRFAVSPGDLIMSCSGTMGKIAIIPNDAPSGIINQALLKLTPHPNVNNRYLKYCFEDSIALQMNAAARGGAIKNVASVSEIRNIEVQIPSIEEQSRIVSILDRFDALCNNLTSGLPAEIAARQKQYEYYRDKLLTFKEKV